MKNIFATFGLSSKMRIRRLAVGFFVVAVLVTVSLFIIKSNKEDADAATADGAKVTVGWDTDTGTISSFGPGTYKWSIGSSTAFCLNPNRTDGPEGGTRHAQMYNGSTAASKLKANMIKLAIYGYTRDNQYGDAIMNDMLGSTSRSNTAYAKIHMAIGYIWEGDDAISTLSSSEKTLVQNMAAVLRANVEGQSNPWVVAKNWQLYIIDPKDIDAPREQNVAWIENTMDYGSINVQKCDSVNTTCNAPGNANFANVHFLLQYTGSERLYNPRKLEFYDPGQVIREGTTNSSGSLSFADLNLTSYKVIENGGSNTSLILNQSEQTATLSSTNKTVNLTFKNQVVRGDVSFFKHSDNGEPMANIPFKITSKTTGESHIVVSDSEGLVSTESVSPRLHSNHTNGYDSSESNPSSITYKGYGTWFGRDGSNASPVRNDLGALPYDTYEIVEISCNQNQFCYDITSQKKTFTIANEHETISLGNWENNCVEFDLGTTATDNEDGDKIVSAKSNAVIKDHVVYTAMKNKTFTVKGVLMDKNTRQPVKNNGANVEKSVTVTPTTSEQGSIDVLFTVDTTAYKGHEIVIFEYLYYGSELVKSHEDYNDSAQTISVYYLGTNATDAIDGNKSIAADADQKIKDTVDYCLKKGETFTIKGVLKDKSTGEDVKVDGQSIEQSITVTPTNDNNCGQTTLIYDIDATALAGKEIVVFEYAYKGTTLVESHENINDPNQSILVFSLGTNASDGVDKDEFIEAAEDQKIKDTVDYCLEKGKTFTIKGILKDKETGESITVDGETVEESIVVTPQEDNCGQTALMYDINATELAGKNLVVFEYAYEGKGETIGDTPVITHENINDEAQTIIVVDLGTNASDAADGDKDVLAEENATIVDKINYCLKAGEEYVVKGVLMDKETGNPFPIEGKFVERSMTFRPTEDCGEIEMTFEFNAVHLAGAKIVVFESVYRGDKLIVAHEDINDDDQTVNIYLPPPDTGLFTTPKTAKPANTEDSNLIIPIVAGTVIAVVSFAGFRLFTKRSKSINFD